MAEPRTIRRVAFQALFQMDATGEPASSELIDPIADEKQLNPSERARAAQLAEAAWNARGEADAAVATLAPEWPAHRQPAVDRALLRIAHYEMTAGTTPPKVAVSEAVRLAKDFSTEKSPSFVNAVLDKLLKRLPASASTPEPDPNPEPDPEPAANTPQQPEAEG
ncbi:MAG: transcription antitermination factor NusB [Planctomycetota bacterium]